VEHAAQVAANPRELAAKPPHRLHRMLTATTVREPQGHAKTASLTEETT
jgi:hypothetical protein